ncbi:MAG: cytochrome c3 family protein [Candidatus Aminicenantia bacterium]
MKKEAKIPIYKNIYFYLAILLIILVFVDKKLLMPYYMTLKHKAFESQCSLCHQPYRGAVDYLCLSCHKEVEEQKIKGKGYHAFFKGKCSDCHKEHRGRKYPLTQIDQRLFNHDFTGFHLEKYHYGVPCEKCHKAKNYSGEQKNCLSCHKEWKQKGVDHSKFGVTNLEPHPFLSCDECHKDFNQMRKVNCSDCHESIDYKQ